MDKVKYIGIINDYYNEQLLYANKYLMFSNIMIYDVSNSSIIPKSKYFSNYFKTKFTETDNIVSSIETHIISKIGKEIVSNKFPNTFVSQPDTTFKHFFIMEIPETDLNQISTIKIYLSDNTVYNSEIGYYSLVLFNDTNTLYNQLLTKPIVDDIMTFNLNDVSIMGTGTSTSTSTSSHYRSLIVNNVSNYYKVTNNTINHITNQNNDLQYYKNLNRVLLYEIQKINDDNDKLRYNNTNLITKNSSLQNSITIYTNQINKLSNDKSNLITDTTRLTNMNTVLNNQNKDILGNIIDNINQLFFTNPIDISNPTDPEQPIDPNQPIIF